MTRSSIFSYMSFNNFSAIAEKDGRSDECSNDGHQETVLEKEDVKWTSLGVS